MSLLATVQPCPPLISITKFPPHTPPPSFTMPSPTLSPPCYSNQKRRTSNRPYKTHSRSASAATHSGFLQIPLSQVLRRTTSRLTWMLGVGALVDRVLRFFANHLVRRLSTRGRIHFRRLLLVQLNSSCIRATDHTFATLQPARCQVGANGVVFSHCPQASPGVWPREEHHRRSRQARFLPSPAE